MSDTEVDERLDDLVKRGLLLEREDGMLGLTDALESENPELYNVLAMEIELEYTQVCFELVEKGLLSYEITEDGLIEFQLTEAGLALKE